ncbi:MAG: PPOX class F420-dependent oxidoreductase [Ilumatobacteraceae bacterium]
MSSDSVRSLAAEKYVSFVSFRRNGTPVATPVWIAPYGDAELCFTTGGDSAKIKRLAADGRVTIQPCDMRGRLRPGTSSIEGRARVVSGSDFAPVEAAVKRKYGMQYRLVVWSGSLRALVSRKKTADCGVIVNISFGRPEASSNDD